MPLARRPIAGSGSRGFLCRRGNDHPVLRFLASRTQGDRKDGTCGYCHRYEGQCKCGKSTPLVSPPGPRSPHIENRDVLTESSTNSLWISLSPLLHSISGFWAATLAHQRQNLLLTGAAYGLFNGALRCSSGYFMVVEATSKSCSAVVPIATSGG